MKKARLLGALAALLALPSVAVAQSNSVSLLVKDATVVTKTDGSTVAGGSRVDMVAGLKIGNYDFAVGTTATGTAVANFPQIDYADEVCYLTLRANKTQSVTISAPEGDYMTGVTLHLTPTTNASYTYPADASYEMVNTAGQKVGAFTFNTDRSVVTWTSSNTAGYQTLKLNVKPNSVCRITEFDITLAGNTGAVYKNLFTFGVPNGTQMHAGNVSNDGSENTLGNLSLKFTGKPTINPKTTEKVTLLYNNKEIATWEDLSQFWVNGNDLYLEGVELKDVINPGTYTLIVPRGFFMVGDEYDNGGTAVYTATPNLMGDVADMVATTYEGEPALRISPNKAGLEKPVLTDSFRLWVSPTAYTAEDAIIDGNDVVVKLPGVSEGNKYVDLRVGSIAWFNGNVYVYSQGLDQQAITIVEETTDPEDPQDPDPQDPETPADGVVLKVADATSVTYGSNTTTLDALTAANNNLKNLVIGGYDFAYECSNTSYGIEITKGTDPAWAVSYRPNSTSTVTVTAPEGKYMSSVALNLVKVGEQAYPTTEMFTMLDANGQAVAGEFTVADNVVTWKAAGAGNNNLRLVYKGNVSVRTASYVVTLADDSNYADLFTLETPDKSELTAGDTYQGIANTFGSLGFKFEEAPAVNEECTDAITLTYGKTLVKAWAATSPDLYFQKATNSIFLDGLTDLDVVNPGVYVLNVPRGFFKVGDKLANGVTATYTAVANVEDGIAAILEPTSATVEFNVVKIGNTKGMTEPVLTDAFALTVRGKIYGKDDVKVVDNEVVCTLENPTTQGGTYYIVLAEGSIAWATEQGNYVYSQAFDNYAVDILGGAEEQADVKLLVKDATSATYMNGGVTKPLSEIGTSQNNLTNLVIGGYNFDYTSADNTSSKAPQLYKGTEYDWAVSFRQNNEATVTITAPAGSYMTGVAFNLVKVGDNDFPAASAYKMTDAQGQALEGNFEVDGNVVTWTGNNAAGYSALRLVYKSNVPMRTYGYDIKRPAEGGNMSYADLFTFDIADGTEMYAGDANIQLSNTFGNLGFAFEGKPVVNENCTEKITLTYAGNIVKEWAVDSENLYFESRYQSEKVFLDGVADEDVVNPGEYTLNVPRGFFKVGDVYANGATATYVAKAYVMADMPASITEPNAQTEVFNQVKIANLELTSEPVITDAFELIALGHKYTKEDAMVEGNYVVVNLVNPTSVYGTYYIEVAEGSVAWQMEEGFFVYNQEIKNHAFEFAAPEFEIAAEAVYGSNEIEVTWTNPAGTYTEAYIRYNNESVKLTADQLAAEGEQSATVEVNDGAWYNVSMVFYGEQGNVESNGVLVWAGEAVNIYDAMTISGADCVTDGEWVYVTCAAFEEGQTYDLNVTARDANAATYGYKLYLGFDVENLVEYGEFTGNINEQSNTIVLTANNMVAPMNADANTEGEDVEIPVQAGNIIIALQADSPTTSLVNFYIGHDATGIKGLSAADGEIEFYTVQGIRVNNPENGVYVVRQNGKSYKVVVRK